MNTEASAKAHNGSGNLVPIAGGAIVLAALALFLVPYSQGHGFLRVPLWSNLWSIWNAEEHADWQHGMIVPLIALGVLYYERKKIFATAIRPSWLGLPVILAALAVYWFGSRADSHYIGWFSVQLLLAGSIIWLLGWRMMATLLFPWAFLTFAWPLPFLTEHIAVPLRHLMAGLSGVFLNAVGIETLKVGTSLQSAAVIGADGSVVRAAGESFMLDVADPCSGIRSLFAIVMVSAIFGYVTLGKWWQRVSLIVLSVPLVILGNFVRMLLLTFGTLWFGAKFAIGKGIEEPSAYHTGAGFAVFAAALGGMIVVQKLLDAAPGAFGRTRARVARGAASAAEQRSKTEDAY